MSFSKIAAKRRHAEPPPNRDEVIAAIRRWRKSLPETVGDLQFWVVWKRIPKPGKPGKFDKVPYYITGRQRHGSNGNPADRDQLADLDGAISAYREGRYHGIGLALLPDVPVWALDLDHCIDATGQLSPLARRAVASGSYCERSPSGTGVRALFSGKIGLNAKNHDAGVETFNDRGFVTITGDRVGASVKLLRCPTELREEIRSTVRAGNQHHKPVSRVAVPLANPELAERLRLPKHLWRRILNPYPSGCDRSAVAFGLAMKLKSVGLSSEQALEVMAATPTFEPALERRGGDVSSAREWLWRYIVSPAFSGEAAARD